MAQLWSRGGLSWLELARRTWREGWKDEVFGQAARLAFYHFLAIFPAILLLLFLLLRIASPGDHLRHELIQSFRQLLPEPACALLTGMIGELTGKATLGIGFLSGLLGAVWASINGTWAMMSGLNIAYEVKEERPWWKLAAIAIGLTVSLAVLGILSLGLIFYGNQAVRALASQMGLPPGATLLLLIVRLPILILLLLTAFALLYRFGPNLANRKWEWSTPGAVVAAVLWVSASVLLRAYFTYSKSYEQMYGHLAPVSMFLLWLYTTSAAILIGGELNSEIEKAADQKEKHYDPHLAAQDDGRSGR